MPTSLKYPRDDIPGASEALDEAVPLLQDLIEPALHCQDDLMHLAPGPIYVLGSQRLSGSAEGPCRYYKKCTCPIQYICPKHGLGYEDDPECDGDPEYDDEPDC